MAIQRGEFEEMVKIENKNILIAPLGVGINNRGRVETQPRCKIQYPMKNRDEDAYKKSKRCISKEIFLINNIVATINKKTCTLIPKNAGSILIKKLFLHIHYILYQLHCT